MTVDVEDYFQVSAFSQTVTHRQWDSFQGRVAENTDRILDLFAQYHVTATFFVLGWVADKYPSLVRRIVREGHELASHGYMHEQIHLLTPREFKQDVERSKKCLEDISGHRIKGYRAPSYSINDKTQWAFSILEDLEFVYSSSVFPIVHDLYGWPNAPRFIFTATPQGLREIPITTYKWRQYVLPCGGGGYFRLFPYGVYKWGLTKVNEQEHQPGIFYFHPWEIDPQQPRLQGLPFKSKCRHYLKLHHMEKKVIRLLQDFKWTSIESVFFKSNQNDESSTSFWIQQTGTC